MQNSPRWLYSYIKSENLKVFLSTYLIILPTKKVYKSVKSFKTAISTCIMYIGYLIMNIQFLL